jgi:tetratricopeptide (TPR) repeat protein
VRQALAPIIDRLDAEIAGAEGVFEREVLKSRRAAVLARHGQFAEARFALAGLRVQSQRLRNPVLSSWAAFVDGLIDHCETLSPSAREKFRRAYELACGADDALLRAESAAWLAVAELNANDIEAAASHAAEALRVAPADGHTARARAALVIGDSWRYAGEDALSQPWYMRVRKEAAAAGDVSLISILLYNMAAFRAYRICLDDAFGASDLVEAQRVLLEAESTGNYDAGVGNEQLSAMVPMLRAQLMVVTGRHAEALALFDAQLERALDEGMARREARFLADAAYAEMMLGRLDEAGRRLRLVVAALPQTTDDDDIAATHARAARVARELGRTAQAEGHAREAALARERHEAAQQRWAAALRAAELS